LLSTINQPRYFAFQFALNFSKFGAFTYFNLLNIASVAFGISFEILITNCVNNSLLHIQSLEKNFCATIVHLETVSLCEYSSVIQLVDSAYGGFIKTKIFLPDAIASRSQAGILFVRE
jgi:hypothetical protein